MSNTQRRFDRDRRDRDRREARDQRDADRRSRCRGSVCALKRVGWVLGASGVLALVISLTTGTGSQRPPAPERLDSMSGKRVTEHVADNGVVGAALAAERALAARDGKPRPRHVTIMVGNNAESITVTPVPVRPDASTLRVSGVRSRDAHLSSDAAKADALEQARGQLAGQLAALDPPVTRLPSLAAVRDGYLKPSAVRIVQASDDLKADWAKAKLETNRVWVEVDLEVTPKQVQQLRSEERTVAVGRVAGAILLVLVGLAGFFKLDALTKGHLTGLLGVGLAGLGVAGVGVAVYLLRSGTAVFG